MENQNLSLQDVLNQRKKYNLAIPFVETQQITPFYKMSVSLLFADTSEQASQIFKVGSKNLGNNQWANLYSLSKPFLEQLATGAGIQFGPGTGDVVKVDENTWKASAFGAIRLPDGSIRTSTNFKVIDLATEEKKYRLAYEEKAKNGISDFKVAESLEKRYKGKWVESDKKNDKGYPIKLFIIDEQDRSKYIENSLLDAMTQLRANAPQKAATGAKLRVIRDLLGIKGTYTMDELKKPFAVARTAFSPDYNDPMIKQMMLQQAMQSIGNMFGNVQPVVQTISAPRLDADNEMDMVMGQIPDEDKPLYEQEITEVPQNDDSMEPYMQKEDRSMDFRCDKCNEVIPQKVWNYSMEHNGRPLCYKCQRTIKNEERGGRK